MPDQTKPNDAVSEAAINLIRSAAKFADAAAVQYQAEKPGDYANVSDCFAKGLAEMVVVVALNPGGKTVQFCADVGSDRHVLLTVPVNEHGAAH